MDLFDLMSQGREDKALDRLEAMLELYESEDEAEQDQALERARTFCDLEWGSYPAGLEVLARRHAARGADGAEAAMQSLRLHEEGAKPGTIIRAVRLRRLRELTRLDERETVIAHYGSEEAVLRPTETERTVHAAAAHLAVESGAGLSGPLAGWQAESGRDLPEELAAAVAAALPLPATIEAARAECLRWEARLRHLDVVGNDTQPAALPTAAAARHRVVEGLWRRSLPAQGLADFTARMEYWAQRGGDDTSGYGILARDLEQVAQGLTARGPAQSTKERARRIKTENPDWSLARIGKELGISRQAVHKHLKGFSA